MVLDRSIDWSIDWLIDWCLSFWAGSVASYCWFVSGGVAFREFVKCNAGYSQQFGNRTVLFHQKYVIVDEETVMFGSCNLTETSFRKHYENLVTTNDSRFVEPFITEFKARWDEFTDGRA